MEKENNTKMLNPNNDANIVKNARVQYYFSNQITWTLAWFSSLIWVTETELFLTNGLNKHNQWRLILLWMAWVANILIWVNIWFSYKLYIKLLQNEHLMYALDDLKNSGIWKKMVLEMMANLVCPLPFLYNIEYNDLYNGQLFKVKTYWNIPLLIFWIIIRTYHLLRVILESSLYMDSRAFRVNQTVGIRVNYLYAFKCIFREYSLMMVGCYAVIFVLIFGYSFRIAELPNSDRHPDDIHFTFFNALWVAIVSMTTVGYGDIVPHTGTGSYVGLMWSVVGIQLTAFFLISFINFLELTDSEQFAYSLRESTDAKDEMRRKALKHIVSFYKYKHRRTERGKELYRKTHSRTWNFVDMCRFRNVEFHNYVRYFREFRRAVKNAAIDDAQSVTDMDINRRSTFECYSGKSHNHNFI